MTLIVAALPVSAIAYSGPWVRIAVYPLAPAGSRAPPVTLVFCSSTARSIRFPIRMLVEES
jgi:hypothetical protein